jgi:hypothetical protein
MNDPLNKVFNSYNDAEKALIDAKFTKISERSPSNFYNWNYDLVDAGILYKNNEYKIVQRA